MSSFNEQLKSLAEEVREAAASEQARQDVLLIKDAYASTIRPDVIYSPTNNLKIDSSMSLEEAKEAIKKDLYDDYYSWIPGALEPYLTLPSPSSLVDSGFEKISGPIDTGEGDAAVSASGGFLTETAINYPDDIADCLADWRGEAASTFKDNFVNDLQGTVQNQAAVAKVLGATFRANYELINIAKMDMLTILKDTVTAIEDSANLFSGLSETDLAIISAVVTVAGGVATCFTGAGFVLLAGGLTAIAGVTSAAAADKAQQEQEPYELGASTVDGVLENMSGALTEVLDQLKEGEEELKKVLDATSDAISEERKEYEPRKPGTLLDAEDPTDVLRPPVAS